MIQKHLSNGWLSHIEHEISIDPCTHYVIPSFIQRSLSIICCLAILKAKAVIYESCKLDKCIVKFTKKTFYYCEQEEGDEFVTKEEALLNRARNSSVMSKGSTTNETPVISRVGSINSRQLPKQESTGSGLSQGSGNSQGGSGKSRS